MVRNDEPMYIQAVLKQGTDILRVYHDLYGYKRVNFGEDNDRNIIYFTGTAQTGRMVRAYLEPLSDKISVRLGY